MNLKNFRTRWPVVSTRFYKDAADYKTASLRGNIWDKPFFQRCKLVLDEAKKQDWPLQLARFYEYGIVAHDSQTVDKQPRSIFFIKNLVERESELLQFMDNFKVSLVL